MNTNDIPTWAQNSWSFVSPRMISNMSSLLMFWDYLLVLYHAGRNWYHQAYLLIPILHPIKEGKWVHCLSGCYQDDTGFVCRHDPTHNKDIMVTFILCIPDQRLHKRKRGGRPEPHKWWVDQLEAVWGKLCV